MSAAAPAPEIASLFADRISVEQVEEGRQLAPKFDAEGLMPVVTSDATSGEVLMLGYMDAAALTRTIASGEAHYWSRSRRTIWRKGASSGLVQRVIEMRIDDDQDAIWLRVEVLGAGASCHVGYRSCFYRAIPVGTAARAGVALIFTEDRKIFDPVEVYGDVPNPTQL